MASTVSRRALFDRLRGGPAPVRPPWAHAEEEFTERCIRCDACIEACPEHILTPGRGGYPVVDFKHGGCTFCGACRDACPEDCFEREADRRPWSLQASISDRCVEGKGIACRMCEGACESSALQFRPRVGGGSAVGIRGGVCTGCGSCIARCPLGAIEIQPATRKETGR